MQEHILSERLLRLHKWSELAKRNFFFCAKTGYLLQLHYTFWCTHFMDCDLWIWEWNVPAMCLHNVKTASTSCKQRSDSLDRVLERDTWLQECVFNIDVACTLCISRRNFIGWRKWWNTCSRASLSVAFLLLSTVSYRWTLHCIRSDDLFIQSLSVTLNCVGQVIRFSSTLNTHINTHRLRCLFGQSGLFKNIFSLELK